MPLIHLCCVCFRHWHLCWRRSSHQVGMCEDQTPAAAHREQNIQDDAGRRYCIIWAYIVNTNTHILMMNCCRCFYELIFPYEYNPLWAQKSRAIFIILNNSLQKQSVFLKNGSKWFTKLKHFLLSPVRVRVVAMSLSSSILFWYWVAKF